MQTPYTRENLIRGFITVLTLVALYFLIRRLSGVLLPFCISLLVAYQMVPLVNFFQYKCRMKNRTLSVITTLVVVIGVLVGAVLLVVPMIGKELVTLSEYVQEFVTNFNASDWLSPEIESYLENAIASMDINSLIHSDDVRAALQKIAPTLWGCSADCLLCSSA